jgi:hypothetical protein
VYGGELGVRQALNAEAGRELHEIFECEGVEEAEKERGDEDRHEQEVVQLVVLFPLFSDVENGRKI